jgi:hypothetical protein
MTKYQLHPNQTVFEVRADGKAGAKILHLVGHPPIDRTKPHYVNDPFPAEAELSPASFLVDIANLATLTAETIEFVQSVRPDWLHAGDFEKNSFLDRCSPTGEPPATHALCWWRNMTDRLWAEMVAWHDNRVPALPQVDMHRWPPMTRRSAAVASLGLKLIPNPVPGKFAVVNGILQQVE